MISKLFICQSRNDNASLKKLSYQVVGGKTYTNIYKDFMPGSVSSGESKFYGNSR